MDADHESAIEALRALALRLIAPYFPTNPPTQEPQLFVARLPPHLPVTIPLPQDSRLVGSCIDRQTGATILLDVATGPEGLFAYYHNELLAGGWTRIEQPPRLGGFRLGRRPPSRYEGGTYCWSVQGPALTVQAIAPPNRLTEVRILLHTDPLQTPCAAPGDPPGSQPLLPDLAAPLEAELIPRSSGGGGNYARAEAQLATDLDLASVVAHYARQLEHAGWKRRVEEARGPYLWSTWSYSADGAAGRHGILLLSILQHLGMPLRSVAASLAERPEVVQLYELEVRSEWRGDVTLRDPPGR